MALIKIDPGQRGNVNPTVPVWGGPNGLAANVSSAGDRVFTYGNSILRAGISALRPKTGLSLGDIESSGGWSQDVYTVPPGIPGDSGSGFMDAGGNALGVLSTVQFAPLAASNGVGTLAKELAYAARDQSRRGHHAVHRPAGAAVHRPAGAASALIAL